MQHLIDTKQLGTMIRDARKKQQLTQAQLAGMSGVGVRFVCDLERGKASCQIGKSIMVAQMLGLTIIVDGNPT
jgi:y4mF family transcriptional regulator